MRYFPGELGLIFRVSASSQLAPRGRNPDLEIGRLPAERVAVDGRALRSGGRARGGVLDEREPVRSRPRWRLGRLRASGQKRCRMVLMIEVWSKTVADTEPGSTHGETIRAGTR